MGHANDTAYIAIAADRTEVVAILNVCIVIAHVADYAAYIGLAADRTEVVAIFEMVGRTISRNTTRIKLPADNSACIEAVDQLDTGIASCDSSDIA